MNETNGPRSDDSVDVMVLGGGPAGSTTATLLKQAMPSSRIMLCERARFPRHHIGESLLPNANPILAKLGVVEKLDGAGFQRKGGVTVKLRAGHPMIREWFATGINERLHGGADGPILIPDHAWQVERSRYDAILLDHAIEAGVEVLQPASCVEVIKTGDRVSGVVVDTEQGRRRIASRWVVDCSGQVRFLGRALGLNIVEHDLGDLAIYRYYDGAEWSEDFLGTQEMSKVFFAVAPPVGWIWYIVLSKTRVSVGVVTRKNVVIGRSVEDVFDETLARVPEMATLLRNARRVPASGEREAETRTLTVANWSYAHERAAGPGWYLAGDAAAFVDPVLSSGVMLAHYAGLWAANAILTEWLHPEIEVAAMHRAYRDVYEDARAGFGDMASWWYSQSDRAMDETWVEHGAKLMHSRQARGAEGLDDPKAFMTLVAGHLIDFRFRYVGVGGFEAKGFADVGGGSYATNLQNMLFGVVDPTCLMERAWDRYERAWYLGTYVESDCWWRLPMVRFIRDGVATEYRPRVHFLASGAPDIERSTATLDTVLTALETAEAFGDIDWEIRRGRPKQDLDLDVLQLVMEIIRDFVRLKVLVPGPSGRPVRSAPAELSDRGAILSRTYERAELGQRDVGSFGTAPPPLTVLTFVVNGQRVCYAPQTSQLPVLRSILSACDGRRSIEEVIRHARHRLGATHDPEVHTAANFLLAELVHIGVLRATPAAAASGNVERAP